MHKIKTFKIPIYFGELRIVISDDFDASCKALKTDWEDFTPTHYDAFVWRDPIKGYTRYFMLLKPDVTPKIIAHESLHIANMLFKDRDITPDLDNDEPQAYLLGWVVECVGKAIDVSNRVPVPAKGSV